MDAPKQGLADAVNAAREAADRFDTAAQGDNGDEEFSAAWAMAEAIRDIVRAWDK
jgi:hypothetical protein